MTARTDEGIDTVVPWKEAKGAGGGDSASRRCGGPPKGWNVCATRIACSGGCKDAKKALKEAEKKGTISLDRLKKELGL